MKHCFAAAAMAPLPNASIAVLRFRAPAVVIASVSEAIQQKSLDRFVASLLAMTENAPAHRARCAVNG
jgi:hypothetical protein